MAAAQWPCPIAVTPVSLFGPNVSVVDTGTQTGETVLVTVIRGVFGLVCGSPARVHLSTASLPHSKAFATQELTLMR